MADLQYSVGVNANPAIAGLNSLQSKISATTGLFSKLQGALAGLAIGAAVANAVRYADAINDIADATGIAIANIAGFSKAVTLNGGDAEKAQAGIVKLVAAIGEATEGSSKAQYAFGQVGVTLNDLATLSEQEIFNKTIYGLSRISDTSTQAALKAELLGKSFRSININGVANGYGAATAGAAGYAASIEKAAALQDKMDQSMEKLREGILNAIAPLADFVAKLDQEKINQFIDATVKISAAAIGLIALGKGFEFVAAGAALLASAFALFKLGLTNVVSGFAVFMTGLRSLKDTFVITFSVLKNYAIPAWLRAGTLSQLFAEISLTVSTLGKRFAFFAAGSAAGAVGLGAMGLGLARMIPYIGWLLTAITALDFIIKKAFDWSPIDAFTSSVGKAYNAFKKFLGLQSESAAEAAAPARTALPDTGAGGGRGGNAQTTQQQIEQGSKMREESERNRTKLREVTDAFAKQRIEIQRNSIEFAKNNKAIYDSIQLESMLIGKSKESTEIMRAQADLSARTRDAIDSLREAKSKLSKEELAAGLGKTYDQQIAKVKELAEVEQARITQAIEDQNRLQSLEQLRLFGIQQEIDLQSKLESIQDTIAKSTMTTIEQKYYDIDAAAKAAAKSAIQAEEARVGRKLNAQEVKAYYDAAIKGAEELKALTDQEYQNSRSFATGWAQAFNEYAENASNAAQRARDIFSQATNGMTNLIVGFAKTGKFEWRGFVNDMLETLLKSQLQQTITKLFSTMGINRASTTSGGLFGGSIIPGFLASGGPASSNRSYLVGERGPEIFSPSTNGTVIPNSALGGGGNVTYNISAVDAPSFQALIARDPGFIHAVAMAGARSLPNR